MVFAYVCGVWCLRMYLHGVCVYVRMCMMYAYVHVHCMVFAYVHVRGCMFMCMSQAAGCVGTLFIIKTGIGNPSPLTLNPYHSPSAPHTHTPYPHPPALTLHTSHLTPGGGLTLTLT